jgi:hypothetical protein
LVDTFAFVESCGDGAEGLEFVETAFHGVAFPVAVMVEGGWSASVAAAVTAVLFLVFLDRDDRSDTASAQVGAIGVGGVGLVGKSGARGAAPG